LQLPPLDKKVVGCKQMLGNSLKFTQNEKGITILTDGLKPDFQVSTLVLETR
jgi:hypothetical protein